MASAGDVDLSSLLGEKCYGGLDLAATEDVCSFCLVFPQPDGVMKVLIWNFVSSAAVERRRGKAGAAYDAFVTKGDLIVTDGNSTDYDYIFRKITECAEMFDLQSTAFDRYNSSSLVQRLMREGLDMDPYGQGYVSMTPPIREMEVMVKQKKLHHGGHTMLRWMASNIQVKMDEAMNIKFNKARSQDKIDGMVALAMAVGEWMTCNREGDGSSVYENQGLREL
jgi:phage terminase large subunit-like protein